MRKVLMWTFSKPLFAHFTSALKAQIAETPQDHWGASPDTRLESWSNSFILRHDRVQFCCNFELRYRTAHGPWRCSYLPNFDHMPSTPSLSMQFTRC